MRPAADNVRRVVHVITTAYRRSLRLKAESRHHLVALREGFLGDVGLAELLQISLSYQALDISLPDIELTVLSQIDSPNMMLVNAIVCH